MQLVVLLLRWRHKNCQDDAILINNHSRHWFNGIIMLLLSRVRSIKFLLLIVFSFCGWVRLMSIRLLRINHLIFAVNIYKKIESYIRVVRNPYRPSVRKSGFYYRNSLILNSTASNSKNALLSPRIIYFENSRSSKLFSTLCDAKKNIEKTSKKVKTATLISFLNLHLDDFWHRCRHGGYSMISYR